MVIFTELQMQGNKHVHVNTGLLEIVINTFRNQEVNVYCDDVHKDNLLKKHASALNLKFNIFPYTGDKELRKIHLIYKIFRECTLAYKIFRRAKKENAEVIIFASGFPFTALFLNFLAKFFNKKIIVCMHGDLGVLSLKSKKFTIRVFRSVVKRFFLKRHKETFVLLYGQSIKDRLFKLFPHFYSNNIIVIDHPYQYDNLKGGDINKGRITVANIGTGIMNKNSHLLYELAQSLHTLISSNRLKLLQIGNVSKEVLSYSNKYVSILNNNQFLPSDMYENAIKKSDYFVYFFKSDSIYDLCPSGTFFDALKYQKPIIALHNPFFDYYFEMLGNIGYLCNNVSEMHDIIDNIVNDFDEDIYNNQIENLNRAQQTLSTENISKSFMSQFKLLR